jgi:hypothetical protein
LWRSATIELTIAEGSRGDFLQLRPFTNRSNATHIKPVTAQRFACKQSEHGECDQLLWWTSYCCIGER